MWFKTRVGYYCVHEPMQIRTGKYDKAEKGHFSIFAMGINAPNIDYKGILGKLKATGGGSHLAKFLISDSSAADISACMKLIEEAILTEAKLCDLSAAGDEAAWDQADWTLIDWSAARRG
jgi:hypothetical protein